MNIILTWIFFSIFCFCYRVTHHSVRQKLILNWSNLERVHTQRSSKDTASKLEWFIVCPFDFIRIYGWNVNLYSEKQWSWIYTSSLSQDILLFFPFCLQSLKEFFTRNSIYICYWIIYWFKLEQKTSIFSFIDFHFCNDVIWPVYFFHFFAGTQ